MKTAHLYKPHYYRQRERVSEGYFSRLLNIIYGNYATTAEGAVTMGLKTVVVEQYLNIEGASGNFYREFDICSQ